MYVLQLFLRLILHYSFLGLSSESQEKNTDVYTLKKDDLEAEGD